MVAASKAFYATCMLYQQCRTGAASITFFVQNVSELPLFPNRLGTACRVLIVVLK